MPNVKVLTYNMCFGLEANSFFMSYFSTWHVVHRRRDPVEIAKKTDLADVLSLVEKHDPDVVVLNEVFDDLHTKPLKRQFKKMGYNGFFIGHAAHYERPLHVCTVVLTKRAAKEIECTFCSDLNGGSGEGAVSILIPSLNLLILGVHMAYHKQYLIKHRKEMDDFFARHKAKKQNMLFVGDFNRSAKYYKKHTTFAKEMKYVKVPYTFPNFVPVHLPAALVSEHMLVGQIDHMFYTGKLKELSSKTEKRRSDHLALIAEFEVKK